MPLQAVRNLLAHHLALGACALSLLTAAQSVSAQSTTTIDEVGEAFHSPALGISGIRASSPRRTQPGDSVEALGALDDNSNLVAADGPGPIAPTVHATLGQLRSALWYWLDAEERIKLNRVDLRNTSNAETSRIRFFLTDRALRRFAPMALGARRRRAEAVALRSASAVHDPAGADAIVRNPVIARLVRRREEVEVASVIEFAERMQRLGSAISRESPTDSERDRAADAAVLAAAEAMQTGDVAAVALTVAEASIAYGSRAERQVVVDEAIQLLEEAVAVARGNPTVERPLPALPISIDPDADQVAVVVNAPRGANRSSGARRGRGTTTVMVPRTGPSAQCYNDFRCFAQ